VNTKEGIFTLQLSINREIAGFVLLDFAISNLHIQCGAQMENKDQARVCAAVTEAVKQACLAMMP